MPEPDPLTAVIGQRLITAHVEEVPDSRESGGDHQRLVLTFERTILTATSSDSSGYMSWLVLDVAEQKGGWNA